MKIVLDGLTRNFGDLTAVDDVSMTVNDGEFVTLVGPSGCGKTTTLRCIAGLETPSEGRILFGNRDVTGLSPQERNIAFVFQNYALYPHMTARQNMSFALEDTDQSTDEIDRKVSETAEMLGIDEHLEKNPGELSGGQQQRVALGRSIVREPDVFLLDEPLSNLDAKLRVQMRAELQTLHQELGTTMIYVTHDQEEAMTMSDRIAVMNQGRIQQVASPNECYHQPANRMVAGFIGSPAMNFIEAKKQGKTVTSDIFSIDAPQGITGDVALLGVRPEDISFDDEGGQIAEVRVFEQVGSFNIIYLSVEGYNGDVIAQTDASQQVAVGDRIPISVSSQRVCLFDESGDAVYTPSSYEQMEQSIAAQQESST